MKSDKRRNLLLAVFIFEILLFIANIPYLRIDVDEAWLGEQAHFLSHDGTVRSEMFDGFLHYDQRMLVYHKGFILIGALFLKIFGFALFHLRLMSILSLGGIFVLMYRYCRKHYDSTVFLISGILLLLCPLIFRNSIIYRPEALIAMIGLASFVCLVNYLDRGNMKWLVLSGAIAGLAVFCHLNGVVFVGAGGVLLLLRKKWSGLVLFGVVSIAVSSLYFYDVIGHWALFKLQFMNDPSSAAQNGVWYQPILNLLNEHKRIFRKPEIIGITSLFIITVIQSIRDGRRGNYNMIIYSVAAVVFMGLLNHNKTTKYGILYFPYFVMLAADNVRILRDNPRLIRRPFQALFALMLLATVIIGLNYSGRQILTGKQDIVKVNREICSHIPPDSYVLAPLLIMYNEIDRYKILGLLPTRIILKSRGEEYDIENLCRLAKEKGVEYVIIDDAYRGLLGCGTDQYPCFNCADFVPVVNEGYYQLYALDTSGTR